MLPVVHCDADRRAANKALEEEVAKEQKELVKLSQTNEENRACEHVCARACVCVCVCVSVCVCVCAAPAVVRLHAPTNLPTVAPFVLLCCV